MINFIDIIDKCNKCNVIYDIIKYKCEKTYYFWPTADQLLVVALKSLTHEYIILNI